MAKVEMLDFETREATLRRMLGRGRSANLPGLLVGQTFRSMATILADEFQGLNYQFKTALANGLPTTSSGPYLDMMGESLFGLERQGASACFTQASDQNVMFYAESGTLFDYVEKIGDGRGRVPQGTLVFDQAQNEFMVIADVYVLPGDVKVFASVEATFPGRSKNVPANALVFHNLDPRIKVNNKYDISNGQDVEDDNNYRFRIMQAHLASQGGNRASINQAVAGVPGISRFIVTENVNGPGTVEILLLPAGNRIQPSILELARQTVQAMAPAASIVSVREPDYVEFEMTIKISMRGGTAYLGSAVQQATRAVALQHMSSIDLGGVLDTDALRQSILTALRQYQVTAATVVCLSLNGQCSPYGSIRLGRRELLTPSSSSPDPVRTIVV